MFCLLHLYYSLAQCVIYLLQSDASNRERYVSTETEPYVATANTQPSAMGEYTCGTDTITCSRHYFWILLGVSLFSVFIIASKTTVFPYSVRVLAQAYMTGGQRPRVFLHKTYTTKPDIAARACSLNSRLCSDSAIRNCLLASERFPKELRWSNTNTSYPNSRFEPLFCRFKYNVMPPQLLQRCLQQKQIKRIALLGDSQGSKYFGILQEMLKPIANCRQVRSDVWENYFFSRKRRAAKFPQQRTHVRRNALLECVFVNASDKTRKHTEATATLPQSVFIEIISVISFTDRKLRNPKTNCSTGSSNAAKHCTEAKPQTLFPTVFGDYFARENHYPDVILLFSFSHDKGMGRTLKKTWADMEKLRDIIRRYVPRSTAFYWFSQLSENDDKKKGEWKNLLYEGTYTANEMQVRTNRALYDVLRDEFRKGRIHTFFDLYAMSLPVPHWSGDGVHLKRHWYRYLMSYWFQSICSKFM